VVDGRPLTQPQVPVTLPTYDEAIGRHGINGENFNDHILSLMRPDRLNVLTIHAEVEGGICRDLFERFVTTARSRGISFVPLSASSGNRTDRARRHAQGREDRRTGGVDFLSKAEGTQ
jgi:hypothetical protein